VPLQIQNLHNSKANSEATSKAPVPLRGTADTNSTATANSAARSTTPAQKAGGRYKFKNNCDGWRSEDRRYKCNIGCKRLPLDFPSHAAYYVIYCDVADRVLRAVYYGEAAQVVLVEEFENIFIVRVGRHG
jgi:hypothetical protein